MIYIVCGVSGTGKSTVGRLLAERINLPFYDGDDFHSEANIQKMKSGEPLTDEDRFEWLKSLSVKILEWNDNRGAVLACSALKEGYRQMLIPQANLPVEWIILHGDKEVILDRISRRKGHFFDSKLLDSQLDIFEFPRYGIHINVNRTIDEIVIEIVHCLPE